MGKEGYSQTGKKPGSGAGTAHSSDYTAEAARDTGVCAVGAGGSREKPEQGETTFYSLVSYKNC